MMVDDFSLGWACELDRFGQTDADLDRLAFLLSGIVAGLVEQIVKKLLGFARDLVVREVNGAKTGRVEDGEEDTFRASTELEAWKVEMLKIAAVWD